MTDDEQIRSYLRSVQSSLRVPRGKRARVLEDIESHLREGSAERMRTGATPAQATAHAIEMLGPPEAVAAEFTADGPPIQISTGLLRWSPLLIPLSFLTVAVGFLIWSITWMFNGWSAGERVAQRAYLQTGVIDALFSYAAYLCIKRADRDRAWRWAAWACTGLVLASLAIW